MPWSSIVIWIVVALLSFLWGSAVLGISLEAAERGASAWWLVLVLGPIPIVALLFATSRLTRRRWPPQSSAEKSGTLEPVRTEAEAHSPPDLVPEGSEGADITDREREVLALLGTGRTQAEIAKELFVAPGTVKAHVNNIYRKLGARNRTEALARARELGLLG
jgi:DNA-binding NarL/FixJ family response regulator